MQFPKKEMYARYVRRSGAEVFTTLLVRPGPLGGAFTLRTGAMGGFFAGDARGTGLGSGFSFQQMSKSKHD